MPPLLAWSSFGGDSKNFVWITIISKTSDTAFGISKIGGYLGATTSVVNLGYNRTTIIGEINGNNR